MLISYLIEFLLHEKKSHPSLICTIIGSLLIIAGIITGGCVLFYYLVPIIGYNEAGLAIFLSLTVIGVAFLKLPNLRKKTAPTHDFLKLFQTLQNQIDFSGFLKGNGKKALVLTAIGGILLSQLLKSSRK